LRGARPTVTFDATIERLRGALAAPLPGPEAQDLLTPIPRRDWPAGFNPARARHAAGLLLVFPIDDRPHIVLTVRSDRVRHSGQVSLPGGVVEPGESFEQAALREAHEEVGLDGRLVQPLGLLTPVDIPVSGFRLQPVVAVSLTRPALQPADIEVARIIEADVAALMTPEASARTTLVRDGRVLDVPTLTAGGAEIWGATAMVLAEFLVLLGWSPNRARSARIR
jgi:8-oxo-dGTP pyrophosphatase MutT (NUDIX family)